MPIVIALQGKANTGKTNTLNLLIDMISLNGNLKIKEINDIERWAVGDYNGINIAITTQGDSAEEIKSWLNFIHSITNEINVYVCPCRTRGSSYDFVYNFFKPQNIIFHGKWFLLNPKQEDDIKMKLLQEEINRIQAEVLCKKIYKLKEGECNKK